VTRTGSSAPTEFLVSRNPATEAELGRVAATDPSELADLVSRARASQAAWQMKPWRERRAFLERWRKTLSRDADEWVRDISAEVGKPKSEALAEVVTSLDALHWTIRHAGRALGDEAIGAGWQRLLLMSPARLRYRPWGVIGILGTWNYPLFLNAPAIGQALAAGNGVVWKPSELAPLLGQRLQRSLEEAGLPAGLVATVFGGAEAGRALVGASIDKGVFTGGIPNGRKVLQVLAERGIACVAELSGFDPAIVLPDAPLESTVRALSWGAFVGCGQACVAIKRVYVVGDPARWLEALSAQARQLRIGDPAAAMTDIGPLISRTARDQFHAKVQAAIDAGARVVVGGVPQVGPGAFYPPTILATDTDRPEQALAGAFGPVVLVRTVPNAEAAIDAANASEYGLSASVWGRDLRAALAVGERLAVGMVTINDAVTPTGHAAAPFGGMKASGHGRTHGVLGIREFTQAQVVHQRLSGGFRPQLYPYSRRIVQILSAYRRVVHPWS
jgi:acyl-CoA reductase-like NAD-dependent aldehyde dehydrogenase